MLGEDVCLSCEETRPLHFRAFSAIESRKPEWLWYPYLPKGKIVLLSAMPGTGKTFFSLYLCSVISRGGIFFGEPEDTRRLPYFAVYQTAEDGVADTLKARLEMMIPTPDYRYIYNVDESECPLSFSEPDMIEEILRYKHPALMIFDPLQAYLGADVDMHRANQVRPVMARIGALAEKYNCTMLFVMHHSKMQQSNALYSVLGSVDIPAVARSMLMLDKNPENDEQLILSHSKSSLAQHGQSIIFHIEDGNPVFDEISDLTAQEIYQKTKRPRNSNCLLQATELLQAELDKNNGFVSLKTINELKEVQNLSHATFQKAKKLLRLQYVRVGYLKPEGFWISPDINEEAFRKTMAEKIY